MSTPARSAWGGAVLYGLMIAGTIFSFVVICEIGQSFSTSATIASTPALPVAAGHASGGLLFHILLALAAVMIAGQAVGWVFRWLHQPPVIGEVLAGIALGPSLLGQFAPEAYAYLLPTTTELDIRPILGIVAQLGVILYMFLIGMQLDARELRHRGHAAVAVSHASIAVPFLLGGMLALAIYPYFATGDTRFSAFAIFLGVALSVTAFPVLARILSDRGMTQSPLGVMAITCAAIDDATAWCLLALAVGVAQGQVIGAVSIIVWTVIYLATMLLVVRPLIHRWIAWHGERPLSHAAMAVVLLGLLVSSSLTEWIGIHAIFGAFVFGACIPHDSPLARDLAKGMTSLVVVLFLPAFFAFTGMRTNISLVSGLNAWLVCGLIILVATIGKFGGTLVAARLAGQTWRDSAALGVLMNTRGLMELIVLNIGLDLKIISPTLFAMLVIMALVTTIATGPLLELIARPKARKPALA